MRQHISQKLAELGSRIKDRRIHAGLSQETVAEKAGVSTNTIIRIEAGQMAMSIEIFMRLVDILGTDADSLLEGNLQETGGGGQCRDMLWDIMHLRRREREAVMQAVEKLLDGLRQCRR